MTNKEWTERRLARAKKIPFGGTKGGTKEQLKKERELLRWAHRLVGGEDYWRIGDSLATLDYRIRHTPSKVTAQSIKAKKVNRMVERAGL